LNGRWRNVPVYIAQKPVSPFGERFNKDWTLGRLAQNVPQPFDRCVEAMFEVNVSVIWPQAVPQFLPFDNLSRTLQQGQEHLHGLLLYAQLDAIPA
jgi:hypothetical protein